MLSLSASERSCWITLLSYSSVNDNGMITFLSEEQLMIQAGVDFQSEEWDRTKGIIEKLKKLNIIHIDNKMITICNWQKRQETNLTSYERVKKHREKKRNDNTKITLDKNRIDKNRIDNKNPIAAKNAAGVEEVLSLEEETKKLEDSPRRDLNIIAFYMAEKNLRPDNKSQLQVLIKRHLR